MKVIVTGASKGIGRGIARVLAKHGYSVGLLARSEDELISLKKEIEEQGGIAYYELADQRNPTETISVINKLIDQLEGVDALINNAGLIIRKHVADISIDEWQAMVETNVNGPFYCLKAVLDSMQKQGSGHIINVSSISGKLPLMNGSGYAASKYAVNGFSESLFLELREFGIKVTTIFPGSVDRHFHEFEEGQWKVHPDEVGEACYSILNTSAQNCIREMEIRPLRKPKA